jgi:hypothetical protein
MIGIVRNGYDWNAIVAKRDIYAEEWDTTHEVACAIDRVDDPHPTV